MNGHEQTLRAMGAVLGEAAKAAAAGEDEAMERARTDLGSPERGLRAPEPGLREPDALTP